MCKVDIIAGPCSIETKEQFFYTCEELSYHGIKFIRGGVWKPRTKPGGFEGLGEVALKWVQEYKEKNPDIKFCCEVANKGQVELALQYGVDALWIGARTTTDPFAVQEIAEAIKEYSVNKEILVFVKNPVCPDLDLWVGAVERLHKIGINNVAVIHRGFKVYNNTKYRNEPLWNIPLSFKLHFPDVKMYLDPSHIAGNREYIEELINIAINIYSYDGIMVESHYLPEEAWTDAKQQLTPNDLNNIIERTIKTENNNDKTTLEDYRLKIDEIDNNLLMLLHNRMEVSKKIGEYKKRNNMKLFQKDRFISLLNKLKEDGKKLNLDEEYIENIWNIIHEESINKQIEITE